MKIFFSTLCCVLLILSMSCKENTADDFLESVQSAEDNSISENEFSTVFDYVNTEGINSSVIYSTSGKHDEPQVLERLLPVCATVTIDTATKTITIDFGTTNCLCIDGRYRRGKIIAVFIGKWKDIGSSVTVTVQDYYINDYKVTGTKTVQRIGEHKWSVNVQGASVTTENGTISWNAMRTVEQTEGYNTLTIWDDVFVTTGSASGTNRRGVNFTVTVDVPLKKVVSLGCFKNFTEGKWTLINSNQNTMSLDYYPENGACDKLADITFNGVTRRITLR